MESFAYPYVEEASPEQQKLLAQIFTVQFLDAKKLKTVLGNDESKINPMVLYTSPSGRAFASLLYIESGGFRMAEQLRTVLAFVFQNYHGKNGLDMAWKIHRMMNPARTLMEMMLAKNAGSLEEQRKIMDVLCEYYNHRTDLFDCFTDDDVFERLSPMDPRVLKAAIQKSHNTLSPFLQPDLRQKGFMSVKTIAGSMLNDKRRKKNLIRVLIQFKLVSTTYERNQLHLTPFSEPKVLEDPDLMVFLLEEAGYQTRMMKPVKIAKSSQGLGRDFVLGQLCRYNCVQSLDKVLAFLKTPAANVKSPTEFIERANLPTVIMKDYSEREEDQNPFFSELKRDLMRVLKNHGIPITFPREVSPRLGSHPKMRAIINDEDPKQETGK